MLALIFIAVILLSLITICSAAVAVLYISYFISVLLEWIYKRIRSNQKMRHIIIFHESFIARWFLPKSYSAIMLFGMVFTRYSKLDDVAINHEWWHTRQYMDIFSVCLMLTILATTIAGICDFYPLWWAVGGLFLSAIAYYIWYVVEYLVNLIKCKDHDEAYYAISFEKQAYALENDFLSPYKHFSWLKY